MARKKRYPVVHEGCYFTYKVPAEIVGINGVMLTVLYRKSRAENEYTCIVWGRMQIRRNNQILCQLYKGTVKAEAGNSLVQAIIEGLHLDAVFLRNIKNYALFLPALKSAEGE